MKKAMTRVLAVLLSIGMLIGGAFLWHLQKYAAEIGVQTVGEGSELESYYTYTPMVGNVPVVGSQIKLMVGSTGSTDCV